MKWRSLLNKALILGFFSMIGYSLAASVAVGSVIGVVLSLVSLTATVAFLYYLVQRQYQVDQPNPDATGTE